MEILTRFKPSSTALAQMPKKPVRADGIATYQKLLKAIDKAFATNDANAVRLKDIAEDCDVPVASVYHFFPVPEAALAALTEKYTELAAIEVLANHKVEEGRNWQGVVNTVFERTRVFYGQYPAARKLRFGVHQSESTRYLMLESNWVLAGAIKLELERLFKLPNSTSLIDELAYTIVISDAFWSLSISIHGSITDELALEAERAVTAFLLPTLGGQLPLR